MKNWSEKIVGAKHTHHITNKDIARKLKVTPEYISMALNGKKSMPNAEQRIMSAINEIIKERT